MTVGPVDAFNPGRPHKTSLHFELPTRGSFNQPDQIAERYPDNPADALTNRGPDQANQFGCRRPGHDERQGRQGQNCNDDPGQRDFPGN